MQLITLSFHQVLAIRVPEQEIQTGIVFKNGKSYVTIIAVYSILTKCIEISH